MLSTKCLKDSIMQVLSTRIEEAERLILKKADYSKTLDEMQNLYEKISQKGKSFRDLLEDYESLIAEQVTFVETYYYIVGLFDGCSMSDSSLFISVIKEMADMINDDNREITEVTRKINKKVEV